ncbi:putative short-chain dehydrogenase [Mycobacterium xenopi 3993]|nr:putative short-chain dehydrogenase [Mycobacterium xenopi 3993]
MITRPRLTGICGSDSKQILLDFGEGDTDNALAPSARSRKSWGTRWSPT